MLMQNYHYNITLIFFLFLYHTIYKQTFKNSQTASRGLLHVWIGRDM